MNQTSPSPVLSDKDEQYQWIQKTLVQFRYLTLKKSDRDVVIRYLINVSGYSRQQLTRLIKQYAAHGKIVRRQRTARGFSQRYTATDIRLLARLSAHLQQVLSQPPCDGNAYAFRNRAGNPLKILQWDGTGVWLSQRRLHRGSFRWPRAEDRFFSLTQRQRDWLITGVDWQRLEALPNRNWQV